MHDDLSKDPEDIFEIGEYVHDIIFEDIEARYEKIVRVLGIDSNR